MSVMREEIFEQPAALRRALDGGVGPVRELVDAIKQRDIRYVVLVARGTSDNAATYAKYLLQIICGIPVALAAPSVHTLYEATPNYRDALVIGVSQSGAGEDINTVLAAARQSGALTAAITNTADSPMAEIAEHLLLCHAGVERAVAATKTYTTTLALFALLAAVWSGNAALAEGLDGIADAAERTLFVEERARALAQTLIHAERILTIARGLHLSTAIEASLKIAETTYTTTQAFSSADLLHGPIASVPVRTPCLLFEPAGRTVSMMQEVAEKLRARGARVLTLAPESESDTETIALPLTDTGTELLAPLVDILPIQLLACHLAGLRDLDPDNPRGLTKVTITR